MFVYISGVIFDIPCRRSTDGEGAEGNGNRRGWHTVN